MRVAYIQPRDLGCYPMYPSTVEEVDVEGPGLPDVLSHFSGQPTKTNSRDGVRETLDCEALSEGDG
jgi:hypothetical protein